KLKRGAFRFWPVQEDREWSYYEGTIVRNNRIDLGFVSIGIDEDDCNLVFRQEDVSARAASCPVYSWFPDPGELQICGNSIRHLIAELSLLGANDSYKRPIKRT